MDVLAGVIVTAYLAGIIVGLFARLTGLGR